MNLTSFPEKFVSLPKGRACCYFPDENTYHEFVMASVKAGFSKEDNYVLQGEEGIDAVDPSGDSHGPWASFIRSFQQKGVSGDGKYLDALVENLRNGQIGCCVPIQNESEKEIIFDLMGKFKGEQIVYFGTFYSEQK